MSETPDDMSMMQALIALHGGTPRQGPGDDRLSLDIVQRLPPLPKSPRIADLGCGTGCASLLLAKALDANVLSVDLSQDFLGSLVQRAEALDLSHRITPLCADMGALPPADHPFDLIWSEGAAYNLTFAGALAAWRPLLAPGGMAVISEMSWFTDTPPAPAAAFWGEAYPAMALEATNAQIARDAGFDVLFTERVPRSAWWINYYDPLRAQMRRFAGSDSPVMQSIIAETQQEMDLYQAHSESYGYTFYALRAA